ncbi:MAG: PSD1 and planctomycete cytochrome C domain-containing protein [Verrucomicrobia bacterium]|nr:PSD1 and planctomycete cytochrome C domain-containing protein [Verrucomicrobiota bacterium]
MSLRNFAAVGALAFVATASLSAAPVDYVREVKPILSQYCYRCHGSSQQKSGMRADTAAFLLQGGDSGPSLVAGKSAESLIVKTILGTHDDISRMPYKKPALSDAQIALISAWIDQGAVAPANEEPEKNVHWAFLAPVRVDPPKVKRADWSRNPVDALVLARLDKEKIAPSPEADRTTLLRRVSLDLIGLPPTPAEVDAFVNDQSPDAYERVVTRLLASPHYGERWARTWLDVARYADSNGYSIDAPRQIWKYRDWVVSALNRDLPYDQFVIEQLGGDLLPDATVDQKVATGFNRNTQINQEGGIDPEQFRIESVMDRVSTFGTAFLGLTVGCAQCHDHKFDPIKQREYYQLFAIFNNSVNDGHGKNVPGGTLTFRSEHPADEAALAELDAMGADLEKYLDEHSGPAMAWFGGLDQIAKNKLGATAREAIGLTWVDLSLAQKRAVYANFPQAEAEFRTRNQKLTMAERRAPKRVTTLVMSELKAPRPSTIFIKGDFTRPGDPVQPGTPAILPPVGVEKPNRLDLARWLFQPEHPLTSRVMVNRIWQQYFGHGLVETENDFGTQGTPPSHPELLDFLATEFTAQKWSMKALHRLIVTSATYRQSSRARPDLHVVDPVNKYLAHQSRLRLDAELVRDASLTASGLLVETVGGPPVYPPQPDGVMNLGQVKRAWNASTGPDRYRRGLYTFYWRATPHPAVAVFDAADGFSACTRRLRSNTPLQALTLLNDQQFYEFAGALADRILRDGGPDDAARLDYGFRLCVSRRPHAKERDRLLALLAQVRAGTPTDPAATDKEAWTTVARVLLNLDETITRE